MASLTNAGATKDENEVRTFLREHNLERYYENFEREGYETMEFLSDITIDDLTNDIGLKKGHARNLLRKIGERKSNANLKQNPAEQVFSPSTEDCSKGGRNKALKTHQHQESEGQSGGVASSIALMSSSSETEPSLKKISIRVNRVFQPALGPYHIEIDHEFSLVDLLQMVLKDSKYFGNSGVAIEQPPTFSPRYLTITVGNASAKLIDYVPENNVVTLLENSTLNPKNDFLMIKNIIGVYTHGLEKTINLPGDCLLNLAPLGAWIGFGRGPTSVPAEEDNHIQHLFFIKYKNKTFGYNLLSFCKMRNIKGAVLIPHLNRTVAFSTMKSKLESVLPNRFKIVELSDEDFQR